MGLYIDGTNIASAKNVYVDGVAMNKVFVDGTLLWQRQTSVGTLSISATGATVTVNRTSCPTGQGSTGNLSSGAALYEGDVLKVTFTYSYAYERRCSVNGTAWTSGNSYTVTNRGVSVYASSASYYWENVWSGEAYMSPSDGTLSTADNTGYATEQSSSSIYVGSSFSTSNLSLAGSSWEWWGYSCDDPNSFESFLVDTWYGPSSRTGTTSFECYTGNTSAYAQATATGFSGSYLQFDNYFIAIAEAGMMVFCDFLITGIYRRYGS